MNQFINKAKGRIKQSVGALTGDRRLKREGKSDEIKGEMQGALKDIKHTVADAKAALKGASK